MVLISLMSLVKFERFNTTIYGRLEVHFELFRAILDVRIVKEFY